MNALLRNIEHVDGKFSRSFELHVFMNKLPNKWKMFTEAKNHDKIHMNPASEESAAGN